MIRTLLYLTAGIVLGLVIHIVVILSLPAVASRDAFSRISELDSINKVTVLPAVEAGQPNPLQLDPEILYAVCEIDLAPGPGVIGGVLPDAFWSVAVFGRSGVVLYSTTNRDGLGQRLELGIFNATQTELLAEQAIDVAEGLLIVESGEDHVFVLVRLAPPYPILRERYAGALAGLTCGNVLA